VYSHGFFSHIGSSGQQLPNGNTFICSDTEGHFFEVTVKGELAWEYINPVARDGPVKVLGDGLPMTNSAFRAYRYGTDHPAFKGRDLSAKGTITERAEQGIDTYQKRRPPEGDAKGGPAQGGQGARDGERRGGGEGQRRSGQGSARRWRSARRASGGQRRPAPAVAGGPREGNGSKPGWRAGSR
jgi:hypothetical protein